VIALIGTGAVSMTLYVVHARRTDSPVLDLTLLSGLVPMSAAIAGSEVAITVESMFSMNKAAATMSGIKRSLFMRARGSNRTAEGCSTDRAGALLRSRQAFLNPW
jgi:hypothetical protein